MTKDEMKDKISMALKDPILQQGFKNCLRYHLERNYTYKGDLK